MHRSTLPARLITIVIAVVLTPVALSLLTTGGMSRLFAYYRYATPAPGAESPLIPLLLQVLAIALLVVVVLTGIWSSAGLIAAGVLGLVPLAFALAPGLFMVVYRALSGEATRVILDSLSYGIPVFILPVLGMMGLTLALVRRRRAPGGTGLAVTGYFAAPLLLLVGGVLAAWGLGTGMLRALSTLQFDLDPVSLLATLGGFALIAAGILATRWSTFALILPALVLLAVSAVAAVPEVARWFYVPSAPEFSRAGSSLLLLGAGTAAAFAFLAFTVTLAVVKRRSRALPAAQPHLEPAPVYPPAPPAPYPPQP